MGIAAAQESSISEPGLVFGKLPYNHPGLMTDLGVGLWAQPLPILRDDGRFDLLVATADVPSNGIWTFTNQGSGQPFRKSDAPLGSAVHNITVSYVNGKPVFMTPGTIHPQFMELGIQSGVSIPIDLDYPYKRMRARQWRMYDYEGDGDHDILIGIGIWDDYGWDDAYDAEGNWTNGPLHGYVYLSRNLGTDDDPQYHPPVQLNTTEGFVDVFGAPSPNLADWDGDGDLDLLCGSFLDELMYFENTGSREAAQYAPGRDIKVNGEPLRMELQMLQVVAVDWDSDGDTDLIVGEEDGRVALVECTGRVVDGLPEFKAPVHFQQEADYVKVGALATPYAVDWDGDDDEDLISGDTAGYISFVENLGGGATPKWAAPVRLEADGETIRIQAGRNGSIQGPAEAKWGYTVPSVVDWNHDGRLDILVNSIWGEILWYENAGNAALKAAQPVRVSWDGAPLKPAWFWWDPKPDQLVTQWRTSPIARDFDGDGLNDLAILDHEGYLALFKRVRQNGQLVLLPGERIFRGTDGEALRLNERTAGKSGRRKLAMTDWDGDGDLDLLANSMNVELWRNVATEPGTYIFENAGNVSPHKLAGHTTSPTVVDWNDDGVPDLLVGAEDGYFYYAENSRSASEE